MGIEFFIYAFYFAVGQNLGTKHAPLEKLIERVVAKGKERKWWARADGLVKAGVHALCEAYDWLEVKERSWATI